MGRSTAFYRKSAEGRAKRLAYQKEYDATEKAKKKRAENTRARRKMKARGADVEGKDVAHTKNGLRLKSPSANRGSKSDMPGDRRARAKGRKKK
jgi:hypothetical protein